MLLFLWHNNKQRDLKASAAAQLGMVGDINPKRILALFELANTTLAEAEFTHELIVSHGFSGVMFWRDHATAGGDCGSEVNRKIDCVAFGRCQN